MKHWAIVLMLPSAAYGQMLVPDLLTTLPAQLNESSGLLVLDDAVWTVLDSGAPAAVYQVDPSDGSILRTVDLVGASNTDFEDITADANWVYVGDFGNNLGSRTNLRIYRIPRAALEDEGVTEVTADEIGFSFADQVDFTPAFDNTNFDCEAFIAVDDSLFLFTKRWIDERTQTYAIPATPGLHVAEVRGLYDTDGLVTAASWDGTDRLVLLGHEDDPGQPFVVLFNGVVDHDFFGQPGVRRQVDLFDHQTEGIAWLTPDEWIIGNELLGPFPPALWSVEVGQTVLSHDPISNRPILFPQPAYDLVGVAGVQGVASVRIVDLAGRELEWNRVQQGGTLDVRSLAPGIYIVWITEAERTWRMPLSIVR